MTKTLAQKSGSHWRLSLEYKLADFWIGMFVDRRYDHVSEVGYHHAGFLQKAFRDPDNWVTSTMDVYVCLIPCFPIHFRWWRQ